ncbi:MAG: hypothetical protein D6685_18495 [Bacteroidetes bacterium]|nr:MAG: hypothetical protein D6685_18495 [Bacteroidota bacterium]
MSPSRDEVTARRRAYAWLAEVYQHGLTDALRPVLAAVPDLAGALPEPFDADEAAAAHYRLFGRDVLPYASVFLDAAGRLGGAVTEAVQHAYLRAGWTTVRHDEAADHLAQELAFLAFLIGAEAEARADGHAAEAARMRRHARAFLDAHLLPWLPAFVQAVRQQEDPFYTALAGLTLELALDHRAVLGAAGGAPRPALPPPPPLLEEDRTGLKDIATYLVTTAWSGLYLGQADLARLGRTVQVPRGFGARAQTMHHLLETAVTFDRVPAVLDALRERAAAWQAAYEALAADHPVLREIAAAWQERLAATVHLLGRMQAAAVSTETG